MKNIIPANYANWLRALSIQATTAAGSGHPTSCLSAAEILMALTSHFSTDLDDTDNPHNDRVIFSKGHAAPLLYAWYHTLGVVPRDELLTLRQLDSRLEGHPTMRFEYTEAATGSLGQGLGVGLGIVLGQRLRGCDARTFVLMGDSELAEGSVWEAVQIAVFHQAKNLVALIDLNDLGQTRAPLFAGDPHRLARVFEGFGWEAVVCEQGNNSDAVLAAFETVDRERVVPLALIFHTQKGAGVSFLAGKPGKHGKSLSLAEQELACGELGVVLSDAAPCVVIVKPAKPSQEYARRPEHRAPLSPDFLVDTALPIREVYGKTLAHLGSQWSDIVVLDAETSNSTFSCYFAQAFPERYFEMFIAEQNMVSVATGLAKMGFVPCVHTFGAFFTRAFDQIRMAAYSGAHIVFAGSHVGVSIGEDGSSQMALEDMAMFRSVQGSTVLYPSDAYSTQALTLQALQAPGIVYIRNTRAALPVQYTIERGFETSSSVLLTHVRDSITVIAAGVTVPEALQAAHHLATEQIFVRVIDMHHVKPVDQDAVQKAMRETTAIIVVEDHYAQGGLYSAVCEASAAFVMQKPVYSLAVRRAPRSGKPAELLRYMGIDAAAIVECVHSIVTK
jgi:transketolase